jgi:hypothetical protein
MAVDLGGEEAVRTTDALAGDPRANTHYMELDKKGVARRITSCVSAQEYSGAVCAWIEFIKFSCSMFCALVTCSPCQASPSSCFLNRRTYTPKVSSIRFLKALLYPLTYPSILASSSGYP